MQSSPTQLTDVPANQVGSIVQQLIATNAMNIQCARQVNGSWTILAS
jgi:hypothetical protein